MLLLFKFKTTQFVLGRLHIDFVSFCAPFQVNWILGFCYFLKFCCYSAPVGVNFVFGFMGFVFLDMGFCYIVISTCLFNALRLFDESPHRIIVF